MDKDQLVECGRCNGNACYEQVLSEKLTTWLCLGCGFTSSTELVKGSKVITDAIETSPELYKDLMFEDSNKQTWLPSTVTLPAKGMVFIDVTNKSNWKWSSVKAIEITEEERKIKQFPSDQTYRMDMKNSKQFGQKDFMDALDAMGFFEA